MTNNNNNKKKTNKNNGKKGNPVSFNTRLPPTRPIAMQKVYTGRDLIVSDFQGTSTFGSSQYAINPRLPDKFASASLMAERYDMYQFDELTFHYHPTTAVTTTKGVVFLAWEPNANRGPPETLVQLNAYETHSDGPIYSPTVRLSVPKNRLGAPRYTRSGPTGSDLNLYDTGKLIVASDDVAGLEGGYIEVTYKVRFFSYHLEESSSVQARAAVISKNLNQTLVDGVPSTVLMDLIREDFNGDDIFTVDIAGNIILPKGKYLCFWSVQGSDYANEDFAFYVHLLKNGSLVPFSGRSHTASANARLGLELITICNQMVIESNGSDQFVLKAVAYGTVGPLKIDDGNAIMTFLALS